MQELDAELAAHVLSDEDYNTDGGWHDASTASAAHHAGLTHRSSPTPAPVVRLPSDLQAARGQGPPVLRSSSGDKLGGNRERKNSEEDETRRLIGRGVGASSRSTLHSSRGGRAAGATPGDSKISDVVMFDERWREKESRLRAASPFGNLRGWRTLRGADWAVWWLPPAPRVEVAGLLTLWVAVPCVCRLATRHRQGE